MRPPGRSRAAAWTSLLGLACCAVGAGSGCAAPPAPTPAATATPMPPTDSETVLTAERAEAFARLALAGIVREYPNKPGHVLAGPDSVKTPRALHPAFYGSFDWHSSVHGHWTLVRLLRRFPDARFAADARAVLDDHLTPAKMQAEAAYFHLPGNGSFERTYGWAWLLRLVAECEAGAADDPDLARWREALRPLEDEIVARALAYLPKLPTPIRTGVHPDTGFALAQILDYARRCGRDELAELVVARAREWYGDDRAWPVAYEPSGEDFFSSGLNEADLMRRVLSPDEFAAWLDGFLPDLADGGLGPLASAAAIPDFTDGRLVHLAGLDLSRAWCLEGVADALAARDPADPRVPVLRAAARANAEVGLAAVFSGHYAGEHWLASFAVYLLDAVGRTPQPGS